MGIYKFFWWFSGAHIPYIIPYPVEYNKFFHIGLTIFLTWIFATISGIIVFSNIIPNEGNIIQGLSNKYIIVFSGLLWGLVILNIDRYIAVTIIKRGNLKRQLFFSEKISNFIYLVTPVIPRVFIAIIISLLISTPIKLHLFKDTIETRLNEKNQEIQNKFSSMINEEFDGRRAIEKEKIRDIEEEIESEKKTYREIKDEIVNKKNLAEKKIDAVHEKTLLLEKEVTKEMAGNSITGKAGCASVCEQKKKELESHKSSSIFLLQSLEKEIQGYQKDLEHYSNLHKEKIGQLNSERTSINSSISNILEEKENKEEKITSEIGKDTLIRKIEALFELVKDDKNIVLRYIYFVLVSFFIILETAPIFFKILAPRGPYDAHYEREVERQMSHS